MNRSKGARLVGGLILVAVLVWFVAQDFDLSPLQGLSLQSASAIIALSVAFLALRGLQLAVVGHPYGIAVGTAEAIGLASLQTLANYLPARTGVLVRGVYLREVHRLPLMDYAAMTAFWMMANILAAVAIGLAVGVGEAIGGQGTVVLRAFGSLLATISVGYILLQQAARRLPPDNRFGRMARQLYAGLKLWRRAGPWRWQLLLSSLLLLVVASLRFLVVFGLFDSPASLTDALVLQALLSASLLVSITPGNIGVREGIATAGGGLVGITPEVALSAALVERAATLVLGLVGTTLLGYPILREARRRRTEGGTAKTGSTFE